MPARRSVSRLWGDQPASPVTRPCSSELRRHRPADSLPLEWPPSYTQVIAAKAGIHSQAKAGGAPRRPKQVPPQVYVGRFYRPLKQQISIRVDADVLAWFRAQGRRYQTYMNAVLHREMQARRGVGRRGLHGKKNPSESF